MSTAFFSGNTLSVKRFILSILVIATLAFLTLAFPSTGMRLGEMNATLYRLVITYNENGKLTPSRHAQIACGQISHAGR